MKQGVSTVVHWQSPGLEIDQSLVHDSLAALFLYFTSLLSHGSSHANVQTWLINCKQESEALNQTNKIKINLPKVCTYSLYAHFERTHYFLAHLSHMLKVSFCYR